MKACQHAVCFHVVSARSCWCVIWVQRTLCVCLLSFHMKQSLLISWICWVYVMAKITANDKCISVWGFKAQGHGWAWRGLPWIESSTSAVSSSASIYLKIRCFLTGKWDCELSLDPGAHILFFLMYFLIKKTEEDKWRRCKVWKVWNDYLTKEIM